MSRHSTNTPPQEYVTVLSLSEDYGFDGYAVNAVVPFESRGRHSTHRSGHAILTPSVLSDLRERLEAYMR